MTNLMNTVRFRPLDIIAGSGASLIDRDGRCYIDFFTDVGTASLGYNPVEMTRALTKIERNGIIHSPILFQTDVRERAAEAICRMTDMNRAFFCNSGAEAVEAAIKLVRKRYWMLHSMATPMIWTYRGGFHGRTLAGIAAGDGPTYHREGFGPLPAGFAHFEDYTSIPHDACAVMLSPVFGNNDVREYPDGWLAGLREFCNIHDIALIFDEVQSGSGRTGHPTYAKRVGVSPDIMTLGKGVAMGAPVGVLLARGKWDAVFSPGSHFSTFGGNPLCCEFLLEMIDWLTGKDGHEHLARVNGIGHEIADALRRSPAVKGVRHVGMLIAADVTVDTLKLAARCEDRGLLLGAFRQGPGPLKITPPLNIKRSELGEGMNILLEELAA